MYKILQICVEGNTGSTGRMAEEIGLLCIKNGWQSFIAHGRFSRPSKSIIVKIGSKLNVIIHGLESRIFDNHGFGSRFATFQLIKKIREINPDIIHLHHLHGYYINIEILFNYLSKANIPVVWTFHDCWSMTGHCCHFDFINCNKWETECNHCPQKKEYPASYFFDRSKKNYELKKNLFTSIKNLEIISVSSWLDNIVSRSFLKNIKHNVIYNGIDINLFKPIENSELKKKFNIENKIILLGVANPWTIKKGINDFIKLSEFLHNDEIIILVGLSKSQIKQLPHNIIGITKTEHRQQLVELYNIAEVFLNLSVEETFGLTTAEALACGTPAVVYDATACPEIIDSNTGIVVSKNDIIELKKAIAEIRNKGKSHYSKNCRHRALDFFNQSERLNEYLELYKQLLANNKN